MLPVTLTVTCMSHTVGSKPSPLSETPPLVRTINRPNVLLELTSCLFIQDVAVLLFHV